MDEKEVDRLVDTEHMTQCEDAWLEAALDGVKLALAMLELEPFNEQALKYLGTYGNIQRLPVTPTIHRILYVRNYGEEEVQAMEDDNDVPWKGESK